MVIHMSPDIDLRASRVYNAMSQGVLTAAAAIVLGMVLANVMPLGPTVNSPRRSRC